MEVNLEAPEVKAAIAAEAKKLFDAEAGGLKKKNDELLDEVKDLKKKFDGLDPEEFKRLKDAERNKKDKESDPTELRKRIEEEFAPKLTKAEQERDEALKQLKDNQIDNQLTSALTEAGVAKEFLRAVKSDLLHSRKVDVKDGGAIVDGAALTDFVKTWAASDGKPFIAAPNNQGGGAGGGAGGGSAGGKKISEMSAAEKAKAMQEMGREAYLAKANSETATKDK